MSTIDAYLTWQLVIFTTSGFQGDQTKMEKVYSQDSSVYSWNKGYLCLIMIMRETPGAQIMPQERWYEPFLPCLHAPL